MVSRDSQIVSRDWFWDMSLSASQWTRTHFLPPRTLTYLRYCNAELKTNTPVHQRYILWRNFIREICMDCLIKISVIWHEGSSELCRKLSGIINWCTMYLGWSEAIFQKKKFLTFWIVIWFIHLGMLGHTSCYIGMFTFRYHP